MAEAPTEREKGFVRAVDALFFGAGEETDRRVAYADEMERLAAAYPDDHEVQAFYALALLATSSDYGYEPYRTNVKAGAIALRVFDENPDHPGAAHYIIHAFDDPIHAAIALPAATRFAAIAPGVVHALHMPSHIFIQLGMWDDVSSSNAASYAAAIEMFERQDTYESDTQRYFNARNLTHALDWGQYGDLQRGDYAKAWQAVENGEMVIANTEAPIALQRAAITRPRYVIETEQWQVIEVSPHAAAGGHLANGISAVRTGDLAAGAASAAALAALDGAVAAIAHHEVTALLHAARGDADAASASMDKAIELAESRGAPRGAPTPLKPAHELYGEILHELGRPAEAVEQFKRSLRRTPTRSLSLRGFARAAVAAGDPDTARAQVRAARGPVARRGGRADRRGSAAVPERPLAASERKLRPECIRTKHPVAGGDRAVPGADRRARSGLHRRRQGAPSRSTSAGGPTSSTRRLLAASRCRTGWNRHRSPRTR